MGGFFLSLALLICGLGLTYIGTIRLNEGMASLSWQTCEGIITYSEIEHSRGRRSSHEGSVRYNYVVDGKQYTGDRYKIGYYGAQVRGQAQKIVSAHPVGAVVTVYYSPSSPEKSVLDPGVHWPTFIALGAGIILLFVGARLAFASVRSVAGK